MLFKLLAVTGLFGITQVVFAQATSICSSVALDADGDGYGWENNQSCVISDQSTDAPYIVNRENGQPVSLTRAYWNADDFYKDIVCAQHYFNGISYAKIRSESLLDFGLLSSLAPFQGTLKITEAYNSTTHDDLPWSLDNGIYTGPSRLGESPWVEVVDYAYGDGTDTQITRVWASDRAYTSCRAVNPSISFIPTGIPAELVSAFDGDCIDTEPTGDGWGWDGTSSCQITAECEDTDPVGDGWGWNGSSSCLVTSW